MNSASLNSRPSQQRNNFTNSHRGGFINPQTRYAFPSSTPRTTLHNNNWSAQNHMSNSSHERNLGLDAPERLRCIKKARWGTKTVANYETIEQIGEGTYGQVFKAKRKLTNELVALKKVRVHRKIEGLPINAVREIKILKQIGRHDNLVHIHDIVISKPDPSRSCVEASIYLVFEYVDHVCRLRLFQFFFHTKFRT